MALRLPIRHARGRVDPARSTQRARLRAARHKDRDHFLALAAEYLDFAAEYLAATIDEDDDARENRLIRLFLRLWECLPFTGRLSDFEHLFASALIRGIPDGGDAAPSGEPWLAKLRELDPRLRFVLVAHELERWDPRATALALRVKRSGLHRWLARARCELCGADWDSLDDRERACLDAVSRSLDASPKLAANRHLCQRVRRMPRVGRIKAEWLEARSALVELRPRLRLDDAGRERALGRLRDHVHPEAMRRPQVRQRLLNSLRFSRHPEINLS